MENIKRIFYLMGSYLKYAIFIFVGYALFRTWLFQYMNELHIYFFLLDVFMFWIICISLVLRFSELENGGADSTFDRATQTVFKVLGFWVSTSFLFVLLEQAFSHFLVPLLSGANAERNEMLGRVMINSAIGVLSLIGTFTILDRKVGPLRIYLGLYKFIKKIGPTLVIYFLHACISYLGFLLFETSNFLDYLRTQIYLDAVRYGTAYMLTFLSLTLYGAFYWVYKPGGDW